MTVTAELKLTKQYRIRAASDPFDWSQFKYDQSNLSSFLKLEGEGAELVRRWQTEVFIDDIQHL